MHEGRPHSFKRFSHDSSSLFGGQCIDAQKLTLFVTIFLHSIWKKAMSCKINAINRFPNVLRYLENDLFIHLFSDHIHAMVYSVSPMKNMNTKAWRWKYERVSRRYDFTIDYPEIPLLIIMKFVKLSISLNFTTHCE